MREDFFFFSFKFFTSVIRLCRVCLFFFFSNKNHPSEKKTRKREKFLFCLSSLFSLKSLSLSPSLSPLSLSFFLTRERERERSARPFLVFASFLREYIRERERKRNRDSIDSGLKRNVFIFIFIIFERAYIYKNDGGQQRRSQRREQQ